ncbi:MAG: hypothetical protein V4529_17480 [Gemmatimonadota bacterium]
MLTFAQARGNHDALLQVLHERRHENALRQFELAALEYQELQRLGPLTTWDERAGQAEAAAVYSALAACAFILFNDHRIQRRFPHPKDLHRALTQEMTRLFNQTLIFPGLHEGRVQGTNPGTALPNRQNHSDGWIARRDEQVRAGWPKALGQPSDIEVAGAIPIPPRTYRRWKQRQHEARNK